MFALKKTVHFLHVGKTGGTAVSDTLTKAKPNRYKLMFHQHEFYFKHVPANEKIILFLRDPAKRFFSGFYSRKRMGKPKYNVPWTESETVAFKNFSEANTLAESLSSPDTELASKAHFAMQSIRHVNSHFTDWLGEEPYFMNRLDDIFFIGLQETLSDDFVKLQQKLEIRNIIQLPDTDSKTAHKNDYSAVVPLSDTAISNLTQWYKKDYEIYDLFKNYLRYYTNR